MTQQSSAELGHDLNQDRRFSTGEEQLAWEDQQLMYRQSHSSVAEQHSNLGYGGTPPQDRYRSASDDEIIPFFDPSVTPSNQYQPHHVQHVSWSNTLPPPPPPPPPPQENAYDYGYGGLSPANGHGAPGVITWSEPGHPLLSPSKDEVQHTGYGSTARTPPPPSSTRSSRRKSTGSTGHRSSPRSSIYKTPPQHDQHQLSQIYSSGNTKSPSNSGYVSTEAVAAKPPPRPSSPSLTLPRPSLLSRNHRRVHSATDSTQRTPLLSRSQEAEPQDRDGVMASSTTPPRPRSSHKRTGSLGHHRRNNSLGGRPIGGHRRISSYGSDTRPSASGHHRRTFSSEGLPPVHKSPFSSERKRVGGATRSARPPLATRARSFSSGDGQSGPLPLQRTGSELSLSSMLSTVSVTSVVSDVRRSTLFRGVTKTGKVLFHAPTDKVQLLMDSELESGMIFRSDYLDEYDDFSEYLMDEEVNYFGGCACNCNCDNCAACRQKNQAPSEARYVLTVQDDLYKRVLSEISDSRSMPCRLFYCGHHEDVDHPSIFIAVGVVSVIFLSMACISWIYGS